MVFGQLNGEVFCIVLLCIYIFGFIFCVENFYISWYLVEFWMVELEVVFVNLQDNVDMVEEFLQIIFKVVFNECGDDMVFFVQYVNVDVIIWL